MNRLPTRSRSTHIPAHEPCHPPLHLFVILAWTTSVMGQERLAGETPAPAPAASPATP